MFCLLSSFTVGPAPECVAKIALRNCNSPAGAGFYLNATEEKWKNWRMYDYVVKELPALLGALLTHPQREAERGRGKGTWR